MYKFLLLYAIADSDGMGHKIREIERYVFICLFCIKTGLLLSC